MEMGGRMQNVDPLYVTGWKLEEAAQKHNIYDRGNSHDERVSALLKEYNDLAHERGKPPFDAKRLGEIYANDSAKDIPNAGVHEDKRFERYCSDNRIYDTDVIKKEPSAPSAFGTGGAVSRDDTGAGASQGSFNAASEMSAGAGNPSGKLTDTLRAAEHKTEAPAFAAEPVKIASHPHTVRGGNQRAIDGDSKDVHIPFAPSGRSPGVSDKAPSGLAGTLRSSSHPDPLPQEDKGPPGFSDGNPAAKDKYNDMRGTGEISADYSRMRFEEKLLDVAKLNGVNTDLKGQSPSQRLETLQALENLDAKIHCRQSVPVVAGDLEGARGRADISVDGAGNYAGHRIVMDEKLLNSSDSAQIYKTFAHERSHINQAEKIRAYDEISPNWRLDEGNEWLKKIEDSYRQTPDNSPQTHEDYLKSPEEVDARARSLVSEEAMERHLKSDEPSASAQPDASQVRDEERAKKIEDAALDSNRDLSASEMALVNELNKDATLPSQELSEYERSGNGKNPADAEPGIDASVDAEPAPDSAVADAEFDAPEFEEPQPEAETNEGLDSASPDEELAPDEGLYAASADAEPAPDSVLADEEFDAPEFEEPQPEAMPQDIAEGGEAPLGPNAESSARGEDSDGGDTGNSFAAEESGDFKSAPSEEISNGDGFSSDYEAYRNGDMNYNEYEASCAPAASEASVNEAQAGQSEPAP